MELNNIKDVFNRVAKKQKLSTSKSQEVIDQVSREIEHSLTKIQSIPNPSSPIGQKSILTELKTNLNTISPQTQLENSQKDLNLNLSRYLKLLEKSLNLDISKAYRNVDFDSHIVNQVIVNHFFRQGMFDIGDSLMTEAGEPETTTTLRSHFSDMYRILEAMSAKNLEPALTWVSSNHEKLKPDGSTLTLKLHRLQFFEILQTRTQAEALKYLRTHLSPFASAHMEEIQKLTACLLWANRLETSPYAELTGPTHWEKLAEELTWQFCGLVGQSYKSPLSVVMAAGIEGLPTLVKLVNVMAGKNKEWQAMKQLPVPVDLGKEFQFHSIFVCPVSREQGSDENPPMMMPCGHVLCKQSIVKLSKNSTRAFKCPYCPHEATVAVCKQLYF